MTYLLAFGIFILFFILMAVGLLITKKVLKRGCSIDPDSCTCRREGKTPDQCDR